MYRKGCFQVDINISVGIRSGGEGELSVINDESIIEILYFVYLNLGHLAMAWDFVGPYESVVIGEERTGKKIWLVSYCVIVAVDISFGDVIKEIEIITAGAIVVVDIVLYINIWWD